MHARKFVRQQEFDTIFSVLKQIFKKSAFLNFSLMLLLISEQDLPNNELSDTERQIKCDLLRSMPNNEKFKHWDSEGVMYPNSNSTL